MCLKDTEKDHRPLRKREEARVYNQCSQSEGRAHTSQALDAMPRKKKQGEKIHSNRSSISVYFSLSSPVQNSCPVEVTGFNAEKFITGVYDEQAVFQMGARGVQLRIRNVVKVLFTASTRKTATNHLTCPNGIYKYIHLYGPPPPLLPTFWCSCCNK